MNAPVIVDLLFGDNGKGLATSFLCSRVNNPLVVRFSGGQQCGHQVHYNGKRHIFSQLGSGTLQGAPTYFSKFCTFYPPSFVREYDSIGTNPTFFIHPLCPVTTPFDIDYNRTLEEKQKHGSVGMGFGATIGRQEAYYKLYVQDLFYESVLRQKLLSIAKYYNAVDIDRQIEYFIDYVNQAKGIIRIQDESILNHYNPVFEGSQGILLDMDFGFFPNVTRSNTTSKNALSMYADCEIYYVMRTYLTRHGNGWMPNEGQEISLINNENETNKSHKYQGEFRTAPHDVDLINYALTCDSNFSKGLKKNLVITCNDQYPIDIPELISKINTRFEKVFLSYGDSLNDIIEYAGKMSYA